MAKRSRGSARPGQRAPSRRTASQPRAARPAPPPPGPTARPTGELTEAEEARAAELEAQILEEERAAEAARSRSRSRNRGPDLVPAGARGESLITATAGREYQYVFKDLRRITVQVSALTGVLLVLWVLIEVIGLVQI